MPSRGTVRRSFLRDNTLFPRPLTGYTSVNVCQEPSMSCRRNSRLRAFLRLCFRDGETLLFLHKICLLRRTVCEAVAPAAAYFGCSVVLHDPERSVMKMKILFTDRVLKIGPGYRICRCLIIFNNSGKHNLGLCFF